MADQHDLARDLVGLAERDRVAAEALLDIEVVAAAIVGFHAQQAVEKALKAALASVGVEFPFTHNIALLMQLCEDASLDLPDPLAEADLLTPYGVTFRYDASSPGTVSRAVAIALADAAVAWATQLVDT